jgi:hypothetical protein
MPLSKHSKKTQISRLRGLPFFPDTREAIRDLTTALESVAISDSDAEEIVNGVVRSATRCPLPSDFYRIGRERAQSSTPQAINCTACEGTGYAPVEGKCNTVRRCGCRAA